MAIICNHCGEELSENAIVCSLCGEHLSEPPISFDSTQDLSQSYPPIAPVMNYNTEPSYQQQIPNTEAEQTSQSYPPITPIMNYNTEPSNQQQIPNIEPVQTSRNLQPRVTSQRNQKSVFTNTGSQAVVSGIKATAKKFSKKTWIIIGISIVVLIIIIALLSGQTH